MLLRPDRESLGVTARTELPALARERKQALGRTTFAANAREAVLKNATGRPSPFIGIRDGRARRERPPDYWSFSGGMRSRKKNAASSARELSPAFW